MKKPSIIPWDPADGPLTETSMRKKLEDQGYAVSVYRYPPGTRFDVHTHPHEKIDGVLAGVFRIVLDGHDLVLRAGDMVIIPGGAPHSAEVVGNDPVVSLDATQI